MAPKAKPKAKAAAGSKAGAKAKAKGKAKASAGPQQLALDSAAPPAEAPKDEHQEQPERASTGAAAPASPAGAGRAAVAFLRASGESQQAPAAAEPCMDATPAGEVVDTAKSPPVVPAAAKRPSPSERAKRLNEVPDPWDAVADGAAFVKVVEEIWACVIDDLETESGSAGGAHLELKDGGRTTLEVNKYLEGAAVSLDFSSNDLLRTDALPALWLRNLSLGGNPLESLDGLAELFPRLLAIDLSFVDIPSLEGGWTELAACPNLRSLSAEGAGVSSFEDMARLPVLESLELLENEVEEIEELSILAKRCPALLRLDLRENPVASAPFYIKAVKKALPNLIWHNNQSGKKYVPSGRDKVGAVNFGAEVAAVDGLYKNENCSCLEGNPCIDSITCIDWEHREVVAAEARRRKGLRGPAGEFV